jgi:hypothetical protein
MKCQTKYQQLEIDLAEPQSGFRRQPSGHAEQESRHPNQRSSCRRQRSVLSGQESGCPNQRSDDLEQRSGSLQQGSALPRQGSGRPNQGSDGLPQRSKHLKSSGLHKNRLFARQTGPKCGSKAWVDCNSSFARLRKPGGESAKRALDLAFEITRQIQQIK